MDRISLLPDELLLRILSLLPNTKDVVATMVLSKRWQPLWKLMPKLVYDDYSYQNIEYGKFSRFVDRSLILHEAPVDTLRFKLVQNSVLLMLCMINKLPAAEPRPCWKEPSSVPGCLLSSLETLIWANYEGREEEKQVAAFILRSASFLKKATISSKATDPYEKLEMIKELSSSPRRSPTCQLIFY
ncbi:unnamed protein product [Microthlaspi erraticum]|uniref:FBD domain-containing protein n=1 Tax=Microthlaspi erraticum TaxID=1685480 RepID=A0A6D2LDY9_9BRAS|nr:unnamed protein product [Microthlaspi erraticum]